MEIRYFDVAADKPRVRVPIVVHERERYFPLHPIVLDQILLQLAPTTAQIMEFAKRENVFALLRTKAKSVVKVVVTITPSARSKS